MEQLLQLTLFFRFFLVRSEARFGKSNFCSPSPKIKKEKIKGKTHVYYNGVSIEENQWIRQTNKTKTTKISIIHFRFETWKKNWIFDLILRRKKFFSLMSNKFLTTEREKKRNYITSSILLLSQLLCTVYIWQICLFCELIIIVKIKLYRLKAAAATEK